MKSAEHWAGQKAWSRLLQQQLWLTALSNHLRRCDIIGAWLRNPSLRMNGLNLCYLRRNNSLRSLEFSARRRRFCLYRRVKQTFDNIKRNCEQPEVPFANTVKKKKLQKKVHRWNQSPEASSSNSQISLFICLTSDAVQYFNGERGKHWGTAEQMSSLAFDTHPSWRGEAGFNLRSQQKRPQTPPRLHCVHIYIWLRPTVAFGNFQGFPPPVI